MPHGTISVNCPGTEMLITPAHRHMSFELSLRAGMLAIRTVGAPGAQGATVLGMHGMGVRTPKADAVAAATVGLARLEHIPNGMMFTMGTLSMMLAAGWLPVITRFTGSTTRLLGASPKLHIIIAPLQTCIPMTDHLPGTFLLSTLEKVQHTFRELSINTFPILRAGMRTS
jgi:hypothetical protein